MVNKTTKKFTYDELKFIEEMLINTYLIDEEMKESIKNKCEHKKHLAIMRF